MTKTIVVQAWIESERGWGQRPDGYSIHLSEADRVQFIAEYWKGMPDGPAQGAGAAPDEYSAPSGVGYPFDLTDELKPAFDRIEGCGVRLFSATDGAYSAIREWLTDAAKSTVREALAEPEADLSSGGMLEMEAKAARPLPGPGPVPPGEYIFDPMAVEKKPVVVWGAMSVDEPLRVVWAGHKAVVEELDGHDAMGAGIWREVVNNDGLGAATKPIRRAINGMAKALADSQLGPIGGAKEIRRPPGVVGGEEIK